MRTFYNGGPDAGAMIPSGALLTNVGGACRGPTGDGWRAVTRNMVFRGMGMLIYKSPTPAQQLPGGAVEWHLSLQLTRTTAGATMRDVRVVDTIPAGLEIDSDVHAQLAAAGVT